MAVVGAPTKCPACGSTLSRERWSEGLCPTCVFELALSVTPVEAELFDAQEAPTIDASRDLEAFSEGEIQGERYRIRSLLGRGGMGEVWRAFDLKLRQDVALKALLAERTDDAGGPDLELVVHREALRQEVRLAREVISPNVCRVFDLQELDGRELISMEYVDGTTLKEILDERSPLDLTEAREIASQFLAGLDAIHDAGLVHRDLKPENLMITRTGRVVVMDFGIAKGLGDGRSGMIAGTPAYMSPEQARGAELDARSDIYSIGVVLAEMVAPGGVRSYADRQRLWEAIRKDPPSIDETPWLRVIERCVSSEPEDRYESAAELTRALEEVTLRAADEDAQPYPGLSSFEAKDAEYFFGRELEVEALWKKLRRPHLLAVVGPSGAGKSSFLKAGLLPTLTDGWHAVLATPGTRPFVNLARVLAEDLPGDAAALDAQEPGAALGLIAGWRRGHKHGLVIVDQFEELFTQNPEEVQEAFADLLAALPLEADAHVLLSMRDDFLLHCQRFESLAPLFTDLTPLGPPTGASLRRAIVEPALRCGYRFESEEIVDEMLGEVEGERGALPLVAFSAAQLWERRDRETGLLTRKGYEQIGGVGGALAQHAEAILDYIGESNTTIVRELFRNLVTAQGTRAVREREELLSVFPETEGEPFLEPSKVGPTPVPKPERPAARHVLDALIDARLLTSYEVPGGENGKASQHRIEIVHESLLANWPRLVRWRMQDAEGAQLRDELRAQARLWDEHERSEDYLWTGTAFREYQLWRERYPGGLTALEETYCAAVESLAERRQRRRRIAIGSAFGILLVVLGVIAWFGWQAELSRRQAEAETLRAEASKLLALGQVRFEEDPTEALAYATASLELHDTEEARLFALRTLWEAPPVLELPSPGDPERGWWTLRWPAFSPDGRQLAAAGHNEEAFVFTEDGREEPVALPGHVPTPRATSGVEWVSNDLLITRDWFESKLLVWRLPGGDLVRTFDFDLDQLPWWQVQNGRLLVGIPADDAPADHDVYHLRSWWLPDGEAEELGTVDTTALGVVGFAGLDSDATGWIYLTRTGVFHRPLPLRDDVPDRRLLSWEHDFRLVGSLTVASVEARVADGSNRFWTQDEVTGELRLWSTSQAGPEPLRVVASLSENEGNARIDVDLSDRWAAQQTGKQIRLWDLQAWEGARPLPLRRRGSWMGSLHRFHPQGDWLVASTDNEDRVTFWPLHAERPWVVYGYRGQGELYRPLQFTPDAQRVITMWSHGTSRLWPLPGSGDAPIITRDVPGLGGSECVDPQSRFYVGRAQGGSILVVLPIDGSPPRELGGFAEGTVLGACSVSPSGRLVAAAPSYGPDKTLRVWSVETGAERVFDLPEGSPSIDEDERSAVNSVSFAAESTLYTAGVGGVRRWDLRTGTHELVYAPREGTRVKGTFLPDRDVAVIEHPPVSEVQYLELLDLGTGVARELRAFPPDGNQQVWPTIGPSGDVVARGYETGIIRVGRVSDAEPHLLLGHDGPINVAEISPDGRWIGSTGQDNTLRLWPMPDLDEPPLHTLPHAELIAKLKSLTNIRVVRDPEAPEGWSFTLDPFPGWKEMPEWQ